MTRPRLLDLFCCEGGGAVGYQRAGFDVVGVDIVPQPRYPFEQIVCDALTLPVSFLRLFDAVHASPPCQAHSTITPDPTSHPDLIPATRELLKSAGRPYVIENVEGARTSLHEPFRLCGSSFGLHIRRHRWFESSEFVMSMPCAHSQQGRPYGIYGTHPEPVPFQRPNGTNRGRKARSDDHARDLMGMEWASWHGLSQAIPPAYTEHIGTQLLAAL